MDQEALHAETALALDILHKTNHRANTIRDGPQSDAAGKGHRPQITGDLHRSITQEARKGHKRVP